MIDRLIYFNYSEKTAENAVFFRPPYGGSQCVGRIPKQAVRSLNLILLNHDAFVFQKLLHYSAAFKMVLTCKQAFSVDHPMGWHLFSMRALHGIAHHSSAFCCAQIFSYSAITSNTTIR